MKLEQTMGGSLAVEQRGAVFGDNFLKIEDWCCDSDLKGICQFLGRMSQRLDWWLGDMMCYLELTRKELFKAAPELLGVSERTLYEARRVCELVPADRRIQGAAFGLYRTALGETDSIDKAVDWVERAVEEDLGCGQLRAAMRREVLGSGNTKPKGGSGGGQGYSSLYQACNWARKTTVDSINEIDREALIQDTEPLWALLCRLRGVEQ